MNELDRLIFDDLIMCFFDKWINTSMRDYYLNIFRDAFPDAEVCDDIRQVSKPLKCGCCYGNEYLIANYIEEIN